MWKITKSLKVFFISGVLCLLFSSVGGCSEPRTYQISETQLLTLEEHLNALESNNEMLKSILSASDESLMIALDKLTESQNELTKLRTQLEKARLDAQNAKLSLETANQELKRAAESFKACEAEHSKTESRLRTQRNVWEIVACVLAGVVICQ